MYQSYIELEDWMVFPLMANIEKAHEILCDSWKFVLISWFGSVPKRHIKKTFTKEAEPILAWIAQLEYNERKKHLHKYYERKKNWLKVKDFEHLHSIVSKWNKKKNHLSYN